MSSLPSRNGSGRRLPNCFDERPVRALTAASPTVAAPPITSGTLARRAAAITAFPAAWVPATAASRAAVALSTCLDRRAAVFFDAGREAVRRPPLRSEEHTSELQSPDT